MQLMVQKLINSVVEIILFALIPFIWWLITARKKESFFRWIGLKKVENAKENKTVLWTSLASVAFLIVSVFMLMVVSDVETATSEFTGLKAAAIPAILVYAICNTSLPEEILFRGFLLKRFSSRFGFTAGNITQCALFGLMHGIMFFQAAGVLKAIAITVFTAAIGWLMGYINEQKAGGSILPGWCIHAIANIFSGLCSAFMLF